MLAKRLQFSFSRRSAGVSVWPALLLTMLLSGCSAEVGEDQGGKDQGGKDHGGEAMQFQRIPVQFIAALGEPGATSGSNAQEWGLWSVDPGPRGVRLNNYARLVEAGGVAPAGWRFDDNDWWLEENGLIMEQPDFPLASGVYLVTGDREVTAALTIYPPDENGNSRWELADGATLYDVTHLGCRSARYAPASFTADGKPTCSPADAPRDAFRVAPGAEKLAGAGCTKQDYAVLFVIGVAVEA